MYLQHFGLKENPFALPPDPRYLYLSPRHQEALAHLMYGINEGRGFVQLSGEVGTGKTLLIRALLERLPSHVDAALVLYPFLSVREFLASILDDLKIAYDRHGESLKALIDALNAFLLQNHEAKRRTVLIVDEAHKLNHEVLEQIRLLTNLETRKEKLLQIVLVGQPELDELLALPEMRQLAQRITARYGLKALQENETAEYIQHRCRVAGARGQLFSTRALRAVHRAGNGIPRMINLICDRALLGAYARSRVLVSSSLVGQALRELGGEQFAPRTPSWVSWPTLAAAAALAAVIAVGLWLGFGPATRVPVPAATVEPTPVAEATAAVVTPSAPALDTVLADSASRTDTDSAFQTLFSLWRLDYAKFKGATGCDRAQGAGLRCLYESGTWNNLRQLNRPAVIELVDAQGNRHHVVVAALKDDAVVLDINGRRLDYAPAEIDRYWFGKHLALWNPPEATVPKDMRRGARGPLVLWVREMLTRYDSTLKLDLISDVYDPALEREVKAFQRRHRLDDDGVIGKMTWVQLSTFDERFTPPQLTPPAGTTP